MVLFKKRKTTLFRAILEGNWNEVTLRSDFKEAQRFHEVSYDDRPEPVQMLPLHYACMFNPTTEAIEALLASYPGAIHKRDSTFYRTPLHMAILKGASTEVIELLLKEHKGYKAAACPDRVGRLPLHYAICAHSPELIVKLLLRAYPDGVRVQDANGWLPFHVGCSYGMTNETFTLLLESFPESVQVRTNRGFLTPIDCAIRSGRDKEREKLMKVMECGA